MLILRKLIMIVVVAVIAIVGTAGYRWYDYVTAAKDPLDEVGIELNSRMPMALRKWGCYQLQKRFGDRLPPYGCSSGDGRSWM
ncbi:hypothetical protein ACETRX_18015 [Labrys portucalensis]|uniref:Uncharacterized protein n=1 Tax=Labrys neptuniae TaxID=376174 RepID=A0ABV6ZHC1_9HYPH|nr:MULTISPECIES: hypothetical protein [Labrys]MDT3382461.1 hypothetical protein [Labrys neptuniae]